MPTYFKFVWLSKKYREKVLAWVSKLKFVQAIKASRIYGIYDSLTGWDIRS